eukprot:15337865-Ditylum_brightwellii.AAC.1
MGDTPFVLETLRLKALKINDEFSRIEHKLDPSRYPEPQLPVRQCLWLLTLRCLQHLGNYLCRHVSPLLTADFSRSLDNGIQAVMTTATGVQWAELSDEAKERLRLPIRHRGCGLRQLEDRRHAEFLGGMWHGLPPLLDSTDEEGNHIPGRLNVPAIVNLLGRQSFSSNKPWEELLRHPNSALSNDLRASWTILNESYQDA